jgi:hypothetical protein
VQHTDEACVVVCCGDLVLSENEESLLSSLGDKVPMKVLGPAKDGEVRRARYELSKEPRHYGSDEDIAAYVGKTCGHKE